MPSNTTLNTGSGGDVITTKQRTHDGDTTLQQAVTLSGVTGTEDSYTFVDVAAGAGTAATALRVELPTDGTGVVNLGATDNAVLDAIASSGVVLSNAIQVEDEAHVGGDTGVMPLAVRNDALAALAGTDGDYAPLQVNANGALFIQEGSALTANPASGTIDTVTTVGTVTSVTNDVNIADGGNSITTDWAGTAPPIGAGVEATALRVTLATDSTGVVSVDDGGGTLTIDGTVTNAGTFATQVDGAALTALQLIDNPIVAHDAAATGSTGVNMGGARATNNVEGITQVANADATRLAADLSGCLITRNATTLEEVFAERAVVSTSASFALTSFGAGGAGVHNYVTTISIANTSGTNGRIDISNASASAAGPFWTTIAPSSGGSNITFDPPLKQPTANAVLHIKADVSVNAIYVSLNGFQAQG